jgi:hypothetical protein
MTKATGKRLFAILSLSLCLLYVAVFVRPAKAYPAATIWVTSAANSGAGSLREALQNANAGDYIAFSPAAFPPSSPATIAITTQELPIIDVNGLTLDGSDAGVILNGSALSSEWHDCLIIENASNVAIRGMQIVGCRDNGIEIRNNTSNIVIGGNRSVGNGPIGQGMRFAQSRHGILSVGTNIGSITVKGSLVGVNLAGTVADPNRETGIALLDAASVTVGSSISTERNLISGNSGYGLEIWRSSTSVMVEGNYIGTNLNGTAAIANTGVGILIVDSENIILRSNLLSGNGSSGAVVDRDQKKGTYYDIQVVNNTVGTNVAGSVAIPNYINGIQLQWVNQATIEGNLISGNAGVGGWTGLHISSGSINSSALIRNNIIGLDRTGSNALPNQGHGIYAQDVNVTIGGSNVGDRNWISSNIHTGIHLENRTTLPFTTTIVGNYIGVNGSGNVALGNGDNGIFILKMKSAHIENNIISANDENGINIDGNSFTTAKICNNLIGTDITGTQDFGNHGNGIWSQYASLTIGDGASCSSNVISGNDGSGISAHGNNSLLLMIRGNKIGTDKTGQYRLEIGGDGIWAEGHNLIFGGPNTSDRNLVSGSKQAGLVITGTVSAIVQNNYFGTNIDGTAVIDNAWNGLTLNRVQNAQIFNNIVSGNRLNGIGLETGAAYNSIYNNKLGTDVTGMNSLGNLDRGIVLWGGANHNQIYNNLISGNKYGIVFHDIGTDYNSIYGNLIGMNQSGLMALPNSASGITIDRGAHNTIGGNTAAQRNLISANGEFGIVIVNPQAVDNVITGNYIGVDQTGKHAFGNTYAGIGFFDGPSYNRIGGSSAAERNIISGNLDQGLNIGGYGNIITNNYIGTDVTGLIALPNEQGMSLHVPQIGSSGKNQVSNNLISGNLSNGLEVISNENVITGNLIGVDVSGELPLGNTAHGVYLSGSKNIIGGTTTSTRNVISANGKNGISLGYDRQNGNIIRIAQNNQVIGNFVGVDSSGSIAFANTWAGIFVCGNNNQIGGNNLNSEGNLVSGNGNEGIVLGETTLTTSNFIQGNKVGTDLTGKNPIPNGDTGISIWAGVGYNTIGGSSAQYGNLVAFNHDYGIAKWNDTEHGEGAGNVIAYNEIHHNDNIGLRITVNTTLANNSIYENSDNRIFIPVSTIQGLDQVWSVQGKADSYFLHYSCATCELVIASDASLTLQAGVKVYMDYNRSIIVQGRFVVAGTAAKPVRVTGPYDSIWAGDWKGIVFENGSAGNLSRADIGFAQIGLNILGTVSLSESTVSACRTGGIRVAGNGKLTLSANAIGGNFKDRYIPTSVAYDIRNETTTQINAQRTWWGSVSGPSAEKIIGNINTTNWIATESATQNWQTASLLGEGTHKFVISNTEDLDWFRIPIIEGSRVLNIKLENLPSDYDVFLFGQLGGMSRYPNDIQARRIKHISRIMNTDETQAINQLDDIARVMFVGQYASDDEGLDTGQLLRVSTNPSNHSEEITFDIGNQVGWYYILVAGNNGAYNPQSYSLSITTDYKAGNGKENYYVPVFPPLPSTYISSTLFITNRDKLVELYGTNRVNALFHNLDTLVKNPAVNGGILDISDCQLLYPAWPECKNELQLPYTEWAANRSSVYYANRVAATIKSLLSAVRTSYPNLKYIVLVGDDDVIPLWRAIDESPIANERDYDGLIATQPIGAAFAQKFFLTDDYYAQFEPLNWHGRELFLPQYALGRLVETPEEMSTVILAFLGKPQIQLNRGLITGYDFLTDQAEVISSELGAVPQQRLISNDWTTSDLTNLWFTNPFEFVSLNAHFSHWQAIPGSLNYSQPLLPEQIQSGLPNSGGGLVYSVGCHAGLSVPPGQAVAGKDLDFSQVFAQKGMTYISNTGFSYGDQRSTAFSESLSIFFLRNLKSLSVGEALAKAKNDYYSHTGVSSFSPYDEKTLGETILYGLPMTQLVFPAAQEILDVQKAEAAIPPCTLGTPASVGNLKISQLSCNFTVQSLNDPQMGTYFFIDDQPEINMGQPIQPRTSANISLPDWIAHGVLFKDGSYTTYTNFNPTITAVITDGIGSQVNEPKFDIPTWTPSSWDVINSVRLVTGLEQLLVLVPAQYKPETPTTGTERVFDSLSYTVYYANINEKDFLPPFIWEIELSRANIFNGNISVTVFDRSGIEKVVVTMTRGDGQWITQELTGSGSSWQGIVSNIEDVTFFLQAVDKAGNVAIADNKGNYYTFPYNVFLPLIIR